MSSELSFLTSGRSATFEMYVKPHLKRCDGELKKKKGKLSEGDTLPEHIANAILNKPIVRLEKVRIYCISKLTLNGYFAHILSTCNMSTPLLVIIKLNTFLSFLVLKHRCLTKIPT